MKQRLFKRLITGFLALFLCCAYSAALEHACAAAEQKQTAHKPVAAAATDKCAVCGMFVAHYPGWIAEVIYKDGSVVFFDGPKDLFTWYFNINKYSPQKNREDIAAMYVTSYYSGTFINAAAAYYIIGSDVSGPMGKELIPCASRAEARDFMKDHKGEKVLTFKQLTPRLFDTNQ